MIGFSTIKYEQEYTFKNKAEELDYWIEVRNNLKKTLISNEGEWFPSEEFKAFVSPNSLGGYSKGLKFKFHDGCINTSNPKQKAIAIEIERIDKIIDSI